MIPTFRDAVLIPTTAAGVLAYGMGHAAGSANPTYMGTSVAFASLVLCHAGWMVLHSAKTEVEEVDLKTAVRGMWSRQYNQDLDTGGENVFPREVKEADGLYKIVGIQSPQIHISLNQQGGPPWLPLPSGIGRWQVEAFWELCVRDQQLPTEKLLIGTGKPFSRGSLRHWKTWYVKNQWAVYLRHGDNAGWMLTPRGMRVTSYIYEALQGQLVTRWIDTPSPARQPRPARVIQASERLMSEERDR